MSLGHRVFIVKEDAIFPISQKTFNELNSGKGVALPKFAGQTIQIVVVVYTLHRRKPQKIIHIECERIRILANGTIDKKHEHDGLRLAANRLWPLEKAPQASGSVVDAKDRFEGRQWDQRHPQLSGPSHKRILNALFK